jgi:hypothetical protein
MYGLRLLAGTSAPQSDTTNAVAINEAYLHLLGYQDPQRSSACRSNGMATPASSE